MKTDMENMQSQMNSLHENLERITQCSANINTTLDARREKIEHLSGIHSLLQRLQFMVDLPQRLRDCIRHQAFDEGMTVHRKVIRTIERGLLVHLRKAPILQNPKSPQRTAHSAQRTAHSAQRTAHSAQRTAHSAQRTAHSAQRTFVNEISNHFLI